MKQPDQPFERKARGYTDTGLLLTACYAAVIAMYLWLNWGTFNKLEPNELGDFLAGVFGPVATLWLVLGYLQQGVELTQNTEALRRQALELAATVRQQEQLVAASREQIDDERTRFQLHLMPRIVPTVTILNSVVSQAWLKVTLRQC